MVSFDFNLEVVVSGSVWFLIRAGIMGLSSKWNLL